MPPCHSHPLADFGEPARTSHISKMVLSVVKFGGPEEARTPCKDRGGKDSRAPNHISKMVLSTVHLGPPTGTRTII